MSKCELLNITYSANSQSSSDSHIVSLTVDRILNVVGTRQSTSGGKSFQKLGVCVHISVCLFINLQSHIFLLSILIGISSKCHEL